MIKNILCPIDGSAHSLSAVRYSAPLAKMHGAPLTIFYAKPKEPVGYFGGLLSDPLSAQQYQSHIESQVQGCLQEALAIADELGVRAQSASVTTESPAHAIVAFAREHTCDLIVIASHGRGGVESLILGSVTQKVLSFTSIPVLVVRQSA